MLLLGHETEDDAIASAQILREMGGRARKLLAECVEQQELRRTKASHAAEQLSNVGFLFIQDVGDVWKPEIVMRPSLTGEEALEMLETLEQPIP